MVALRRTLRVAILLVLLVPWGVAAADDVTTVEYVEMIDRRDGVALADVTSIDGVPIDMEAILKGRPEERNVRLDALRRSVSELGGSGFDSDDLRTEAARITSNPPYTAAVADSAFQSLFDLLARLPGNDLGGFLAMLLIVGLALSIAIPGLARLASRRETAPPQRTEESRPVDYQAAADKATGDGDYETAVRMLFVDGTQHLERSSVVPNAATTSTAVVRRIAGNEGFLRRFDEIAYGGSPAGQEDVNQARTGWKRLKGRWSGR